jgi:hypothetical protein
MPPKRNPTQTATVHSTDTDTSAGQANNQVVTRRDLDILAQNLTAAFSEQLRAIVTQTPVQRQTMDEMANQIRNLQDQVNPQPHSSPQASRSGNTGASRSSRRNKRRREMSKIHESHTRGNSREGKSKTASRDARSFLQEKRQRMSNTVQTLVDRKREERRTSCTGSSHYQSPVEKHQEESRRVSPEASILINSPLAAEVLATKPCKDQTP